MRRALPQGGRLKEDYAFTITGGEMVRLSTLLREGGDTLAL